MATSRPRAVVAGAGAGGLTIAAGLAEIGFQTTLLEPRPRPCEKQSGPRGGQARLHLAGAYYPSNPRVAKAVDQECRHFIAEAPDAVAQVETYYFLPGRAPDIRAGWEEAEVPYRQVTDHRTHLRDDFRDRHGITTWLLPDRAIKVGALAELLTERANRARVRQVYNATILAGQRNGARLRSVTVLTPGGLERLPCDVFINAAGAGIQDVLSRVDPGARLDGCFKTIATAVMRFPWSPAFSGPPTTLQLFGPSGRQLLNNLSVIPVGGTGRASVSTSGGVPVADPENLDLDTEAERARLLASMAEAFEVAGTPELQEMSWCVKALLTDPVVKEREGDAGARLVTVLPSSRFGGSENLLICSPGKLSGVFTLRDTVVDAITGLGEHRKAA